MHLCLSLAIPLDILQCVCVVYMRQDNGLFVYLPFDTGPPSPIDPASLFRSPPSWLVMKTLLLERQVLCLKASDALCCDFTGGHSKAYPISTGGIDH